MTNSIGESQVEELQAQILAQKGNQVAIKMVISFCWLLFTCTYRKGLCFYLLLRTVIDSHHHLAYIKIFDFISFICSEQIQLII